MSKSQKLWLLKFTCKYSKTTRHCSHSYSSINDSKIWLVLFTLLSNKQLSNKISFACFTSQTKISSNQKITSQCPWDPQLSFKITSRSWKLLLICWSYLSLPKNLLRISPRKVSFLWRHKNWPPLLKVMIKEIEKNPETDFSMVNLINLLDANSFLSQSLIDLTLPSLGEGGPSRPAVNFRCLYPKNEKCWGIQT